jgi:hypothetical protein
MISFEAGREGRGDVVEVYKAVAGVLREKRHALDWTQPIDSPLTVFFSYHIPFLTHFVVALLTPKSVWILAYIPFLVVSHLQLQNLFGF